MDMFKPVQFAMVGLGGYAKFVCELLLEFSGRAEAGITPINLLAVCEPDQATHAKEIAALRDRGVKVFDRYENLLAEPIDAVWLPLPIDLHRPFTEQALEAGKHVLCEKPAAGCVDDVDAMIAARDRSGKLVAIGYQDIYDPATLQLKRLLLGGVIGKIRRAVVWACWPRNRHYWQRSAWAGCMQRHGDWIMDSPPNNALAHQVNLMPFLLGDALWTSAIPTHVEAELYRAAAIENYDCGALQIAMAGGVELLALLTHACGQQIGPIVTIEGDEGVVRGDADSFVIESSQATETIARGSNSERNAHVLTRFASAIRSPQKGDVQPCTLEIARVQSVITSAASQACPVSNVPDSHIVMVEHEGGLVRAIGGIEKIFEGCAKHFQLPYKAKAAPWTRLAAGINVGGYNHFAGPAAIASASESD